MISKSSRTNRWTNTAFSIAQFLVKCFLTLGSGSLSLILYGRVISTIISSRSSSSANQNRNRVLAVSFRLICILFLFVHLVTSSVEMGLKVGHDHYIYSCNGFNSHQDNTCLIKMWTVTESVEIANNCLWLVFGVANSLIFIVLIRPFQQPFIATAHFLRGIVRK